MPAEVGDPGGEGSDHVDGGDGVGGVPDGKAQSAYSAGVESAAPCPVAAAGDGVQECGVVGAEILGLDEHGSVEAEALPHRPVVVEVGGGGETMNVLLLLGLLITAFAAVLAMHTDEQSRSRH
ncbi:hypothetical protein [Rhodococcus koreensis]|uniref:hypothetical protein n=1 Tax=Rhodococcus koreensis TaxID=99653 RepID=UPI00197F36E4|nr:hypothetical protein [Rhodococcus koreensis]QSE81035.1 hypothetical protein JWS14_18750 [Rhodococcus koreensis]